MERAFSRVGEVGAADPRQGEYWECYERSRDRLVELGCLEKREFLLEHIEAPTPESRQLWNDLCERFPDNPHTTMDWYRVPEPAHVVVWDVPQRIPEWEAFIAEHDVPADTPVEPAIALPAAVESDEPYLGWPEDMAKKTGPDGLTGHPKMTALQEVTFEEYLRAKRSERVENEERRGDYVYYSTWLILHVEVTADGRGHGSVFVTQRFRAPIPQAQR
jgi:hypothetical protein